MAVRLEIRKEFDYLVGFSSTYRATLQILSTVAKHASLFRVFICLARSHDGIDLVLSLRGVGGCVGDLNSFGPSKAN